MAQQAKEDLQYAKQEVRTVEAANTVAVGLAVKDGNADGEAAVCGANEKPIGIVTSLLGNDGTAGTKCLVCYLAGPIVVKVRVGAGNATRGALLKVEAGGDLITATPAAGGGTDSYAAGYATQAGSSGDLIGMIPAPGWIEIA